MTLYARILFFVTGLLIATTSSLFAADGAKGSTDEDFPAFGEAQVTGPVTLRDAVYVDGDVVLLGDVFLNTGSLADKSIAYAPEPGETVTFGARWLQRVARYYGLDWMPRRAHQDIPVIRESHVIDHNQVMDAINLALLDRGYSTDMKAELVSRNVQIYLPLSAQPEVAAENLRVDDRTHRFTVVIAAPPGDIAAKRIQLTGRIYETMEVPVTTRAIAVGAVIKPQDVEWKRLRMSRISKDTVTSEQGIIGMTPRRHLRSGDTFRASFIEAPVLIPNKSLVTVTLEHPFMTLSVQGRALEAGSLGDVIRIRNISSNTIVDAEVIGSGRAVVHVPSQIALNQ